MSCILRAISSWLIKSHIHPYKSATMSLTTLTTCGVCSPRIHTSKIILMARNPSILILSWPFCILIWEYNHITRFGGMICHRNEMFKVEGVVSNIPPKSNTYAHLLILYSEHTLIHLNISSEVGVISGEWGVGFEQKWNWIWASIGT